jgi:hypothetical protein
VVKPVNPRPNEGKLPAKGGPPTMLDSSRFTLICEELVRTGSKYKACEALGFDYSTVANAIREGELRGDDSWREAWDDAYQQFRDGLEQEAFRRARDGSVVKWRFVKKGDGSLDRVPEEMEYSDRLMEVLLKGHFPDRYRDKVFVSGTVGLEPVDAFGSLSPKAKRAIREIIMADLEEQRSLAAARAEAQAGTGQVIDGELVAATALEDMREAEDKEDGQ